MQDSVRAGRMAWGERRPETHLTEGDVLAILDLVAQGAMRKGDIAKQFNIHSSTVSNILSGYSWNTLTNLKERRNT